MEIGPRWWALQLFLSRLEARSPLTAGERDAVMALPGHPHRVAAHRDVVRVGEDVQHVCLVAEGLVARYAQLEDGSRQLVSLHVPGDVVGLDAMMLSQASSPLHALTGSTIIKLPHEALHRAVAQQPGLATALWRDCVADGSIVARWLVNVGRKNARSRIAHLLCEMAVRYERIGHVRHGTFVLPVTQEHIADAVGMTPVHVNRSIKTLREDGLILWARSEVTMLDWSALAMVAEFDADYLHLRDPREPVGSSARRHAF
jgi:CRP-like cAMP-binding protein